MSFFLPELAFSTGFFREVLQISVCQSIDKNELLGGCGHIASKDLWFAGLRTQKRKEKKIKSSSTIYMYLH